MRAALSQWYVAGHGIADEPDWFDTIEAVQPRLLPGRSRHSSAQGSARKPIAAEGHGRLLNYEGRDANLILTNGVSGETKEGSGQ